MLRRSGRNAVIMQSRHLSSGRFSTTFGSGRARQTIAPFFSGVVRVTKKKALGFVSVRFCFSMRCGDRMMRFRTHFPVVFRFRRGRVCACFWGMTCFLRVV